MKNFSISIVLFFSFFELFADDDNKLKLAVMEFEDRSGNLSEKILSDATEYMRGAFASSNKYVVIAKERQEKAMIKELKKESYKSCNDKNCQIPLGQALSADTILRTSINFFGGVYTITSELIDLEKEATIIAAKEEYDGSEAELKQAIDKIVEKIAGVEIGTKDEVAVQQENFYSPADEFMEKTFTGRYNFGILANFDYYDKFGLSTGFDFNFNVFSKPDGGGAGNLFIGFGFDLRFYPPIKSDGDLIVMEIPILTNFGYDFKVNTYALRYVGFWFSPGFNLITLFNGDDGSIEKAFAWELGFEMIFRSRFTVNLGFGGNVVNYRDSSHFFFNIGTVF